MWVSVWDHLSENEQENIILAAKAIYENYKTGLEVVEGIIDE